ncbi:hypothetical protein BAUCODRAFT_28554 [Baudoinia panamericana UAMH 10762]|uniref:Ubiquitin-like domain-containing protein n=1 Tax=Baudoinia panamericana (strain UAMH 10762) TaxID=717646 RepID=M2M4D7_BAUPA|nr:uncharacterized protein BAUCODRAFT_28554 [Baudoinia panamericana UAMH 10762]EMC91451.1 hypothetical protein BAUCODRAFT_28554 [Baudoinia panamericana UAMH 10762]
MAAILSIHLPFEAVAAIQQDHDAELDRLLDNLSFKPTGSVQITQEVMRSVRASIRDLPCTIVAKNPVLSTATPASSTAAAPHATVESEYSLDDRVVDSSSAWASPVHTPALPVYHDSDIPPAPKVAWSGSTYGDPVPPAERNEARCHSPGYYSRLSEEMHERLDRKAGDRDQMTWDAGSSSRHLREKFDLSPPSNFEILNMKHVNFTIRDLMKRDVALRAKCSDRFSSVMEPYGAHLRMDAHQLLYTREDGSGIALFDRFDDIGIVDGTVILAQPYPHKEPDVEVEQISITFRTNGAEDEDITINKNATWRAIWDDLADRLGIDSYWPSKIESVSISSSCGEYCSIKSSEVENGTYIVLKSWEAMRTFLECNDMAEAPIRDLAIKEGSLVRFKRKALRMTLCIVDTMNRLSHLYLWDTATIEDLEFEYVEAAGIGDATVGFTLNGEPLQTSNKQLRDVGINETSALRAFLVSMPEYQLPEPC